MRRPGHLGDLQDFWFGSLGGKYFEIEEALSAEPIYLIRDRVRGRTGEEFKAHISHSRATTLIPRPRIIDSYPHQTPLPGRWKQLTSAHDKLSKIFKLFKI